MITYQTDINLNTEAMDKWLQYRKDLKKPYKTSIGVQQCADFLAKYDYETQMQMVDNSIQNEYQGLFEVKKPTKEIAPVQEDSFITKHTDRSWRDGL